MLHDIYSLGVVFIEIALWRLAITLERQKDSTRLVHNQLFWGSLSAIRRQEQDPTKIKALYQKLARSVVPQRVGGRFVSVIETCLTCVDGEFVEGGDGEEGGNTEVAYLEVVESLEAISL